MNTLLTRLHLSPLALAISPLLLLAACGGSDNNNATTTADPVITSDPVDSDPAEPEFSIALFDDSSGNITNPFLPFRPGAGATYLGTNDDGNEERIDILVSHDTRQIQGITSAIVIDRVYEDDELIEETFDWYAQDINGNVWYMGEDSAEYEDGELVSREGSWQSGLDIDNLGSIAVAGIIMKADLVDGDSYQQEFYQGVAEDRAVIDGLSIDIALADGRTFTTLRIRESDPLEPDAPEEFKYHAENIGVVLEEKVDLSERFELIRLTDQTTPDIEADNFTDSTSIDHRYFPLVPGTITTLEKTVDGEVEQVISEVLVETRVVMGITTVVVLEREFEEDLLTEETRDWFAQDNDGNVWYFGEAVDNYNYDDDDNLVSIDHDGAWEAGVDGAQPGIIMLATPRVGDSYRQEYYRGEAEDLAVVDNLAVDITLGDGSRHTALRIKEWDPLDDEPGFEFKYYVEGIGLVREEEEDEFLDLVERLQP